MDEITTTNPESNTDLKSAVEQQVRAIHSRALALGAQAMCSVILQKITAVQTKSKISYRDYERLIKDIQNFCVTGLSKKISEHDEIIAEENTDESRDSETSD